MKTTRNAVFAKFVVVVVATAVVATFFVVAGNHVEHEQALEAQKNIYHWSSFFDEQQPIQVTPTEDDQTKLVTPVTKDFPKLQVIED